MSEVLPKTRCFRRRLIAKVTTGQVRAALEDDYHHFSVTIEHRDDRVTTIASEALRVPWSTCPGASARLQSLSGTQLDENALRTPDAFGRFQHCTHQLELALFALAQATRGRDRQYDVTITDPNERGEREAMIARNDVTVEAWRLQGDILMAPPELADVSVKTLRPWTQNLDANRYEAVAILRRCLQIAFKRPTSPPVSMARRVTALRNACYAYQDVRVDEGVASSTHQRDFSDCPEKLLHSFH